ncbi:MAG: ABC transporter substrate-binding protein [Gammaproteobacteria bacterium]|nr:ABC transporter substrate-binding protein [Gammaproteobacteria bacterium]
MKRANENSAMKGFQVRIDFRRFGLALVAAVVCFDVAANTASPPEALVRETTDKVLEVLKKEREVINKDPARIFGIVDEFIIPHLDFELMSQRVLGKFWHRASGEQQSKFVREFQTLLVHTYAAALREYSDQRVEFLASRTGDGGQVTVRTQVVQSGGPPIPINYEMHKPNGGWKVYDISIDGVSLVINYRSTFASEIRSNGLDALIDRLVEHNQRRR